MKKTILFIILIAISISAFSQIAFYTVKQSDLKLQTTPRFSIDIGLPLNIVGPWSFIKTEGAFVESGLFVTNNGLIYDEDSYRYIHRILGLSVPIRGGKIVKEIFYLGTGFNFNFPFHYRQKTFDVGTRQNKQVMVSEFFSKHVVNFYPSAELSAGIQLHGVGRFSIRVQIFATSFLNQAYSETIGEYEVKPYENIAISNNFRVLLSYSPGL